VPAEVLAQLGNRVQHALRVFTPGDAKALSSTVSTFPRSSVYDLEQLLPSMGIGEAAVTVLSENGAPTPVAWTRLRPPTSLMAQLDAVEQARLVQGSSLAGRYGQTVDRESAYERLLGRVQAAAPVPPSAPPASAPPASAPPAPPPGPPPPSEQDGPGLGDKISAVLGSSAFRAFSRSVGSAVGREITRSLFGTASRRRRR
jgi:hypothetical protein